MSEMLPNPNAFHFWSDVDEQNAPEPQRFFIFWVMCMSKMLPNPNAFYFLRTVGEQNSPEPQRFLIFESWG